MSRTELDRLFSLCGVEIELADGSGAKLRTHYGRRRRERAYRVREEDGRKCVRIAGGVHDGVVG
mgnify:CR=1 FL=1